MRKGYVQITGLAWSGAGKVTKVEVSTDGGKNWKEAQARRAGAFRRRIPGSILTGSGMAKRPCSCPAAPMKRVTFSRRWRS